MKSKDIYCDLCFENDCCGQIKPILNQAKNGNTIKEGDNCPLDRESMLNALRKLITFRNDCLQKAEFDEGVNLIKKQYDFSDEELKS